MAINYNEIIFLSYCKKFKSFGQTALFGRQRLANRDVVNKALKKIIKREDYLKFQKTQWGNYCEKFISTIFNAISVDCFDVSDFEGANKIFDFNKDNKFQETYDTFVDFGSLEHCFNTLQAMNNINSLVKKNGLIIHSLPANNQFGHGFFQFSPEFFLNYYSEVNGFKDTEIFLIQSDIDIKYVYKIKKDSISLRKEIMSKFPLNIWVKTTKIEKKNLDYGYQKYYENRWLNYEKLSLEGKITKKISQSFLYPYLRKIYNFYKIRSVAKYLLSFFEKKNSIDNYCTKIKINNF